MANVHVCPSAVFVISKIVLTSRDFLFVIWFKENYSRYHSTLFQGDALLSTNLVSVTINCSHSPPAFGDYQRQGYNVETYQNWHDLQYLTSLNIDTKEDTLFSMNSFSLGSIMAPAARVIC